MEKKKLLIHYLKQRGLYHTFVKACNNSTDKATLLKFYENPYLNTWNIQNVLKYEDLHCNIKLNEKQSTSLARELQSFESFYYTLHNVEKFAWIKPYFGKYYFSPKLKGIVYLSNVEIMRNYWGELPLILNYFYISEDLKLYKGKFRLNDSCRIKKLKLADIFNADAVLLDTQEKFEEKINEFRENLYEKIESYCETLKPLSILVSNNSQIDKINFNKIKATIKR